MLAIAEKPRSASSPIPPRSSVHGPARRLINFLCNSILPAIVKVAQRCSRHPFVPRERGHRGSKAGEREAGGNFRHCRIADLIKSRSANFRLLSEKPTESNRPRSAGREKNFLFRSNQRRFSVANFLLVRVPVRTRQNREGFPRLTDDATRNSPTRVHTCPLRASDYARSREISRDYARNRGYSFREASKGSGSSHGVSSFALSRIHSLVFRNTLSNVLLSPNHR